MLQIPGSILLALLIGLYSLCGRVTQVELMGQDDAPLSTIGVVQRPAGFALIDKPGSDPVQMAFIATDPKSDHVFRLGEPGRDAQSPPLDLATIVEGFDQANLRSAAKADLRCRLEGQSLRFGFERKPDGLVLQGPDGTPRLRIRAAPGAAAACR